MFSDLVNYLFVSFLGIAASNWTPIKYSYGKVIVWKKGERVSDDFAVVLSLCLILCRASWWKKRTNWDSGSALEHRRGPCKEVCNVCILRNYCRGDHPRGTYFLEWRPRTTRNRGSEIQSGKWPLVCVCTRFRSALFLPSLPRLVIINAE